MAGGAGELERGQVVVGEHVGHVLDALARLALDPGRGRPVPGHPGGSRDLRVADVPDQQMPEAVLGLPLHRGGTGGAYELLAGQLVQCLGDFARLAAAHLRHSAGPEQLADDGGVLEQALALRRKRVQARSDQGLHRVGERQVLERALEQVAVGEQAHELLRVQRVPARALQQRPLGLRRQHRPLEQRGEQAGSLLVGERREVDRRRVAQPRRPARVPLVELRPSGAEQEQRHPLGPVGQVLEEGEQGRVSPVQVLEHEHRLALCCPRLQEAAPGRERLLLGGRLAPCADEGGKTRHQPGAVGVVRGQGPLQLRRRLLR